MGSPQLRVGNVIDALPNAVVGRPFLPLDAEIAVIELNHIRRHPTARVHAVGDRGDGQLRLRQVRPNVAPHLARHLTVQLADAVGRVGQANRQDGHAERFVVIAGILPAQAQELVAVDA